MQSKSEKNNQSVSLADVNKIKFISATVTAQELNPTAAIPAYLLSLNVGNALLSQHKKDKYLSSAQLVAHHHEGELIGECLVVVANFPRKQIGKFKSDCLVTGLQDEALPTNEKMNSTVAVKTSAPVPDGSIISVFNIKEILMENDRDLTFADFMQADIRVGTVLNLATDANSSDQLLRIDCGAFGEKIAATGWMYAPENIVGKQILLIVNIRLKDFPPESIADSLILSPKEGVWCMPFKPCGNGYRLA